MVLSITGKEKLRWMCRKLDRQGGREALVLILKLRGVVEAAIGRVPGSPLLMRGLLTLSTRLEDITFAAAGVDQLDGV